MKRSNPHVAMQMQAMTLSKRPLGMRDTPMSEQDDIHHLDPDQLLTGFAKTGFVRVILVSLVVHVLVIGARQRPPLLPLPAAATRP